MTLMSSKTMMRLAIIVLICLTSLGFGKKLRMGYGRHDIDTIIKTVLKKAKAVTVTLNSDDLITLVMARIRRPVPYIRKVYFSAYLTTNQHKMTPGQPLVFGEVVVNKRNGYNPITGQFVCPVAGAYWFSLDFLSLIGQIVYLEIRINGKIFTYAHADPKGSYTSVTRNVLLRLNKGDVVTVTNHSKGGEYRGSGRYTGFSGYLLSEK